MLRRAHLAALAPLILLGTGVDADHPRSLAAWRARQAGPESCASCHPEVYAEWAGSHHGTTSVPVADPGTEFDLAIGSSWVQVYLERDERGLHRILERCWDLREERWRHVDEVLDAIRGPLMPEEGAARVTLPTEKRSFEKDCSGCHISGARIRRDGESKTTVGHFRHASIDCEACHGPAAAHVEAWRRMDDGEPLLDLGKLDPRTAAGICARCHGGVGVGSEFVPEDARWWIARPRVGPDEGLAVFSHGAASGQVYQADAFLRSECHLEGNLTCTDCHGWHGDELRHAEHTDRICTRCHSQEASSEHTKHPWNTEGSRCIECHMPRLLTGLLRHQRDHRIASPVPAASDTPDACTACHTEKDKAWADRWYREWYGPPPALTLDAVRGVELARSGQMDEARPLLERAAKHPEPFYRWSAASWLDDPELLAEEDTVEGRLLALELGAGRRGALALARAGLEDPSPILRAMSYLALEKRARKRGEGDEALAGEVPVADLEVAARTSRIRAGARVRLARAYAEQGRAGEAVDVLEETAVFAKRTPDLWLVLAGAYHLTGRDEAAAGSLKPWHKAANPVAHVQSFAAKLEQAGELELLRAVLEVLAAHEEDERVREWVGTRLTALRDAGR